MVCSSFAEKVELGDLPCLTCLMCGVGLLIFRYGEIININLVRDKKSGKSKGYGFLAYEDQRSTILAVDNFNGIKVSFPLLSDL